jgi:replicative DNA helicase
MKEEKRAIATAFDVQPPRCVARSSSTRSHAALVFPGTICYVRDRQLSTCNLPTYNFPLLTFSCQIDAPRHFGVQDSFGRVGHKRLVFGPHFDSAIRSHRKLPAHDRYGDRFAVRPVVSDVNPFNCWASRRRPSRPMNRGLDMSTDNPRMRSNIPEADLRFEWTLLHAVRCEDVFRVAREVLRPEHFYYAGENAQRTIWMQICSYYDRHGTLPTYAGLSAAVLHELQNSRIAIPEEHDAADALLRWMYDLETNPDSELRSQAAIEGLQQILIERRVAQRLSYIPSQGATADILTQSVETAYEDIREIRAVCQSQCVPLLGDELAEYQQRLERHRGRQRIGLQTGMEVLDDRTSGIRGFMLLGAAPGMGKSVYCLQIAMGVCRYSSEGDNAAVVLYLSLDMNADDIRDRMFCGLAGMDWKSYRLGSMQFHDTREGAQFTPAHQVALDEADQKIIDWQLDRRLAIVGRDQVRELTATRISAMARAVKQRSGAEHCLIVVDYLQLLPVPETVARQGDLEADKHRIRIVQQAIDYSKDEHGNTQDAAIAISEARKPGTSTKGHNWVTRSRT